MGNSAEWALRRGGRARLWLGALALGLLIAPGHNPYEAPEVGAVMQFGRTGAFGLPALPDDPKAGVFAQGADGLFYPAHEAGTFLLVAPAAPALVALDRRTGLGAFRLVGLLLNGLGVVLFATTVVVLAGAGARFGMDETVTARRFAVLVLASQYALYAPVAADVSVSAFLLAMCFVVWLRAETGSVRLWLAVGFFAGLLIDFKLSNAVVLPIAAALAATVRRGRRGRLMAVAAVLTGSLPGLAVTAWWNWLRTGALLTVTYPSHITAFSVGRLWEGLAGSMLSPGKGLLVFTPVLLLLAWAWRRGGLFRTEPRIGVFLFGSAGLALLRIGGTAAWSGAGGWGIRYYVPWMPVALLVCAWVWAQWSPLRGWRRVAVAVTVGLGLLVNGSAIVTNWMFRQTQCGYDAWSLSSANVCAVRALPGNVARVIGLRAPPAAASAVSELNAHASSTLATLWYSSRFVGVPGLASWVIGALLGASALWGFRVARRLDPAVAPVPTA